MDQNATIEDLRRQLAEANDGLALLRESEARFRAAFETMIEACCIFEMIYDDLGRPVDWRILEANAGYEQQSGLKDVAGKLASEVMPGTEPYWIETFGRVVETGEAEQIEKWHQPTNRWIHSSTARVGGPGSRRLISVFYDITERKRAEIALRESEGRFRQFAASSSDALWIRDAATMAFQYCSPAVKDILGVTPEEVVADPRLINSLIIPEERDAISQRVDRIAAGERLVSEYRILRPTDHVFRWIRSTGFPLRDENGKIGRIASIASDITEAKLTADHQAVLLAELQHRVRNIMAMTRSIAARSGERAGSVAEYAESLSGRLLALSRVQALLTRAANVSVSLRSIVVDELSVQAQHPGQHDIEGPDVVISPKAAEVLTLAFHELATNALKYGALSVASGKVTVRWVIVEKGQTPWLSLDWMEQGAPDLHSGKTRRQGFGSELIEGRIPYELKGRGELVIGAGGAQCHLEFPLAAGASILGTGAPQKAAVFGGALDMTGEPDLGGLRVLVVEDDYYLATDAARALRGAGAKVMGPCSTEEDAGKLLGEERPDAVLLDINLGSGPTFQLARDLRANRIPFVFVTGYDQDVIPAEFDDVERLEKPLHLRRLVGMVSKLVTASVPEAHAQSAVPVADSPRITRANIDRFLEGLESDNDGSVLHRLILEEERKLARDTEHLEFAESRTARFRKRYDRLSAWRDNFSDGTPDRERADRLVADSLATLQSMEALCQQLRHGSG